MEVYNGIIISTSVYKDNNLIVNLLTQNSIVTFEVLSLHNKNRYLINDIQVLNYGEFELYKGNTKYFKLKACKIEKSLYKRCFEDSKLLFSYEFLKEIILKNQPYEDFEKYFKLLLITIKYLIENSDKWYIYDLLFISFYMRFSGYSLKNVINNAGINVETSGFYQNSEILNIYHILFVDKYIDAMTKINNINVNIAIESLKELTKIYENIADLKINAINLI